MKFSDGNVSQLNCSDCSYLEDIDISDSDIISVSLPVSSVLRSYNLSGTDITSLSLDSQAHLEDLDISDCNKMTSLSLSKCLSLKNIVIPKDLQTLTVSGCPEITDIMDIYISVSGSISPLQKVILESDNNIRTISFEGQNNPDFTLTITGCPGIMSLDLSGITNWNGITLPLKSQMTKLASINISNTSISYLNYTPDGVNAVDTSCVDLSQSDVITDVMMQENSAVKVLRCTYDKANPVELVENAFHNCSGLQRIYGNFIITGSQVFKGCSQLVLNSDDEYSVMGVDTDAWTNTGANLKLDPSLTSALSMFEGDSLLSTNDFRYMIARLTKSLTTVERMFKDCRNISMALTPTLFYNCGSNLKTIDYFLYDTSVSGTIYSGTSGTFSYIPGVTSGVYAFANTNLQWIDNILFKGTLFQNVDYMFAGDTSLKAAVDTTADTIVEGSLDSKTFFINITYLNNVYPLGMFLGCGNVSMTINGDYLFHSRKSSAQTITDTFLAGLKLSGTISENVFGSTGTLDDVVASDGTSVKVYIPVYTIINRPFSKCNMSGVTFNLSDCGNIFNGISTLTQIIYPFQGLVIPSAKSMIPVTLLKGMSHLTSVEGLLAGLGLTNGGADYVFPEEGFFDDCTSLQVISHILEGNEDLHYTLAGDRMKNTVLTDVSRAFASSGLYGTIPYHLFYMEDGNGNIRHTIDDMSGIFDSCWYLGYDDTRRVQTGVVTDKYGNKTSWNDHIISTAGSPVVFSITSKDTSDPY